MINPFDNLLNQIDAFRQAFEEIGYEITENLRENAFVHIKLVANNNEISFEIENNFDPNEINEKPGIGLTNLNLFVYLYQ